MRAFTLMLLMLLPASAVAQQETLAACLDKLAAAHAFASLGGKLSLGSRAAPTPPMLADTTVASAKERPVIAAWAGARAECVRSESRYGNDAYRPPLQAFGIEAENRVLTAAAELHDGKASYGEFNRTREAIAEELRGKSARLNRQIQMQTTAYERADRQTREREQMQREIDEAERQTTLAQQRAAQLQEESARAAALRVAPYGPPRLPMAPVPVRTCYRFGNRIECTGG